MDEIVLKVPGKPDYISVARLTVSGIATRLGLDIDDIEDFKVAISECLIYLLRQGCSVENFLMTFVIHSKDEIDITIEGINIARDNCEEVDEHNELGLYIIESLMSEVEMKQRDGIVYKIILKKRNEV